MTDRNPGDPLDRQIDAALRERFRPPVDLAARLERTLLQPKIERSPRRRSLAWVLVAAAVLVAAFVMLLQKDRRPVLEAKLLQERVSHWGNLASCSQAGVPLPVPLPGPRLALDLAGGSIEGPYAVPEWPGAALFRVATVDPDVIAGGGGKVVHALLVVARADATRNRIEVQEPWTATVRQLGELQVFDFHPHGTPAVVGRLRRLPD